MKALLYRFYSGKDCTLGRLYTGDKVFCVLERPYINNQNNISCIPTGTYQAKFLLRSASGRYKNTYHVQDVDNRQGILIHSGNYVHHSKGCLLLGMSHAVVKGKKGVFNSKRAIRELNKILGGSNFELTIIGA